MISESCPLPVLQHRIARILGEGRGVASSGCVATGHEGVDGLLGGGLGRGRMHELLAPDAEGAGAAAGFAAMLGVRAAGDAALLWLRTEAAERCGGRLHARGLREIGIDPARLLLALVADDAALLRSAADAARCAGLGVLVIESWGRAPLLDLTASRRLMLAAERSGVFTLLLRVAAEPSPSAADTRWSVAPAPSEALAADAPGRPRFDIELLRRRAGPSGMRWRVEWDRDQLAFRAPLSGAVLPVAADRAAAELPPAPVRRTA